MSLFLIQAMEHGYPKSRPAESGTRRIDEQYRRLVDLLPMAVYKCEAPSGVITYFNQMAALLWGRSPEIGESDERFCGSFRLWRPDGAYLPHDQTPMAVALRSGKALRNENVIIERPDRSRIHVLVNIDPIRDAEGRVVGAVNAFHDVTALRTTEEALRESEQRYRAVVELQAEMVCRFRMDGTILFVNAAYARARETTPERMIGVNFWQFVDEADRDVVRTQLETLRPDAPEIRIENRLKTNRGTRWTLWTNRALTFDSAGRAVEVQSSGIDITERKLAEEALTRADRRKDEFLATLAHELRGPLAPLRNNLELLKRAGGDARLLRHAREAMERQLGHLVHLVDDLLDVSRITRDKLELRRDRIELEPVIRQAVESCQPAIDSSHHDLEIDLPSEPIFLDGDAVRLAQVFGNLIGNACKYTESPGRIRVTAEREGSDAVIRVKDTGVGIEQHNLTNVFEMFSQMGDALTRTQGGLGIGLWLTRRLVELHGGGVSVYSEGPGRGSEFVVRLPIAAQPAPTRQSQPLGDTIPSTSRRILVVDDNRDTAESLAMLLQFGGHEVHIAHDGLEAVEAAVRFLPDVVLLDIGLPQLNGYDACRRMREHRRDGKLVIVALTGWGQEEDRRRSEQAGFDAHMTKPVDFDRLTKLLSDISAA